jgi:hypothetical protein
MEVHPMKISFCNNCGDIFARGDALERHCKNPTPPPPECRSATREGADAKRLETEKAHGESRVRLEGFLKTGEEGVLPDHQGEVSRVFEEVQEGRQGVKVSSRNASQRQALHITFVLAIIFHLFVSVPSLLHR